MHAFALWLKTPFPERYFAAYVIGSGIIVSAIWLLIPLTLDIHADFDWRYFEVSLTPRNIAIMMGQGSFGEEFVFRVLPVLMVLTFYPTRIMSAFVAGLGAAYLFGMWHHYPPLTNACIGLGGAILVIVYLKSGGATNQPFRGLLVCGGIHTTLNITLAVLAHIMVGSA